MLADYQPFVERMIQRYEGGYGWNRNDPGGPTKYGITCFDLAAYMHEPMDSMSRWAPIVKAMPLGTADIIYQTKYATAVDFNDLGPGKDCCVFDFGVNSGPSRAVKTAQNIVGTKIDGVMGPVTLSAINGHATFIDDLCDARLRFLKGLGTWGTFGSGWSARVADLRLYSHNLAHPPAMARPYGYEERPTLIPFAYGKGYE